MAVDDLGNRTEVFVEEMNDGAGSKLLTNPCELFDVRKEDGDTSPLGLIRAAGDEPGHQSRIEEFSECILQAITLPQFFDHAIECLRQFANFVSGPDQNGLGIGPSLDGPSTGHELAQAGYHPCRSECTDTNPESAGGKKQSKAQIGVQSLSSEAGARRSACQIVQIVAKPGGVRAERLGKFCKAQ